MSEYTFNTSSNDLIGFGAYSKIYKCVNSDKKISAIKLTNSNKNGIPNMLELVIMATIQHPHICNADRIAATKDNVYIIQKLADCDLSKYIKNNSLSYDQRRKICLELASAVKVFHDLNIIHGDIKSNNVLVYDDTIKLSDFNISTIKVENDDTFNWSICTSTHRPPECFLDKSWNEAVDIWALGCTFYEIMYSRLLFPFQGDKNVEKQDKSKINRRCINLQYDWYKFNSINNTNNSSIGNKEIPFRKIKETYTNLNISPEFKDKKMNKFNKLLFKMLCYDVKKRIKINDVIVDPFFNFLEPLNCSLDIKSPIVYSISPNEYARVSRYINNVTTNKYISSLSLDIYMSLKLLKMEEHTKAITCVFIASKIIDNKPIQIDKSSLIDVIENERLISMYLQYCFPVFTKPNDLSSK